MRPAEKALTQYVIDSRRQNLSPAVKKCEKV
jgi:hypothetical protein